MISEADFILQQTTLTTASLVPEIKLQLATECTPLWHMTEERLKQDNLPPPFWAFAWPGGQGMARYILEHPELVRGKRVLDFAAGSGIAAIAAMKAGAKNAIAVEIDPLALAAVQINAAHNNVVIENRDGIDMTKAIKDVDVILAGDVCYQQAMSVLLMRWLWLCFARGVKVLIADPGRAYVPHEGLEQRGQYVVPTSRDLEDSDTRTVKIWELTHMPEGDL
jgi:predicted nicotinamide N-methyase